MGFTLQVVSGVMANVALLLIMVAVATDHWASRENDKRHTHEGLWTKCVYHKHNGHLKCMKPYRDNIPPKLVATIFLLATTAIVHLVTLGLFIHIMCNRDEYLDKYEKYLAFSLLATLLLTLIAVIIYTTYYNGNYYKLNWSYAFLWGAIISYFAALILQVIHIDKKGKEDSRNNIKYTSRRFTEDELKK